MMLRLLFVFALFTLLPGMAGAQTASDLFSPDIVHDVQLLMHSADLQQMREHYEEDEYYPADFVWRGIRVRNAAVRVRGLATRSGSKPGLRVDFNRYVDGQEFLGLDSLVLDNLLSDPSFLRERTAMAFIARMGGPVPREAFTRVFINGQYEGLYALVESIDGDFLASAVGDASAYLFEHRYVGGFHAEYLGAEYDLYKQRFEPETHRLEPDATLYGPIHDLLYEVNQPVDEVWRERVSRYIDLPQLVRYVAIEMFVGEIDGFLGGSGLANFYLYRAADSTVHRILPWDRDTTFQVVEDSIFTRVQDNELFRRAMAFADLRTLYLDVLAECARSAAEENWLEQEILRGRTVIEPVVGVEPPERYSYEDYERSLSQLVSFAQQRPARVLEEVARSR